MVIEGEIEIAYLLIWCIEVSIYNNLIFKQALTLITPETLGVVALQSIHLVESVVLKQFRTLPVSFKTIFTKI